MHVSPSRHKRIKPRLTASALLSAALVALASCASEGPKVTYVKKPASKEYFSEKDYGVKASPRVVNVAMAVPGMKMARLPRGGGREQLGKPYKVKGKWYVPKEDPNYRAEGTASWYGDAFHGRLTANGEVYDMNHLSAAHPTMPLPSYARVTNKKNGNSVIVRVNDRGPYAAGRVIDLSKRAAQLLDYTSSGTAQVVVEYVGRAPVDGVDDDYLLASYRPGNGNEIEPGVMVASASQPVPQPEGVLALSSAQPVAPAPAAIVATQPFDPFTEDGEGFLPDPNVMPLPVSRPDQCLPNVPCQTTGAGAQLSGYANSRIASAFASGSPFDSLSQNGAPGESILVGTYADASAKQYLAKLKRLGSARIERVADGQVSLYATPLPGHTVDQTLKSLWSHGFKDAFVVR